MATEAQPLTFEVFDPLNTKHVAAAEAIERFQIEEDPQMLPLNLKEMASHPLAVVALEAQTDAVAGYNSVVTEYPGQIIEIGGLYIPEPFRGRGIARAVKVELFARIQERFPLHSLITFCNPASLPLNIEFGFRRAELPEIPRESFELCQKCSKREGALACGRICCDEIMVHEPLGTVAELPSLVV